MCYQISVATDHADPLREVLACALSVWPACLVRMGNNWLAGADIVRQPLADVERITVAADVLSAAKITDARMLIGGITAIRQKDAVYLEYDTTLHPITYRIIDEARHRLQRRI